MNSKYTRLAENYAISEQIQPHGVAELAALGFAAVICNRPDNEEASQPSASEVAAACEAAGGGF